MELVDQSRSYIFDQTSKWTFLKAQNFVCNVVGMSIEKMWRNDEMTNFGIFTQPIPMFFFEVQNWDSQDSAETAAHIT